MVPIGPDAITIIRPETLSFPKIISARSSDAVRTRLV
jgi:hypothetical protein